MPAVLVGGIALAAPAAGAAAGNIIHVPGDAPTIQAGIDLALDGDEVVVAERTWTGPGNRDLDFGGRLITVRSDGGDPALCVIDCQGAGRGFVFQSGETAPAVIRGFAITGGSADFGGAYRSPRAARRSRTASWRATRAAWAGAC